MIIVSVFFLLLVNSAFCAAVESRQVCVVKDPIASVWSTPREVRGPFRYPLVPSWLPAVAQAHEGAVSLATHDSQLLYGEHVTILKNCGSMYKVAIPSQCSFDGKTAQPAVGYVQKKHLVRCAMSADLATWVVQTIKAPVAIPRQKRFLPFGAIIQTGGVDFVGDDHVAITLLSGKRGKIHLDDVRYVLSVVEDASSLREAVCINAKKFLGVPYCWGGRSPFFGRIGRVPVSNYLVPSGVDCSGFISLLMHSVGLMVPRNSGAQYLFANPVDPAAMEPGDVFYMGPTGMGYPRHILMYCGYGMVIEAAGGDGAASCVCLSSVEKRFGRPLAALENGMDIVSAGRGRAFKLYCGSFFRDPVTLQQMRTNFLANIGQNANAENVY